MRRILLILLLCLFGCADGNSPLVDGGGFTFPDATFMDASAPDTGPVDSGPFVCPGGCPSGEACGCLATGCGCHPPQANGAQCDPQATDICATGTECVRARVLGDDTHVCSDGSESTPCSHTQDVCTTSFGCVCLTNNTGTTNCTCTEDVGPEPGLCDPTVPGTCGTGNRACVRVVAATGDPFWVCSDGDEGDPCEPPGAYCTTSLGCACPLIRGRTACSCMEPGGNGAPCDPGVQGSCVSPLMCELVGNMFDGRSTVCGTGMMGGQDGGIPCDPNNPVGCPPGQSCQLGPGGYTCQ